MTIPTAAASASIAEKTELGIAHYLANAARRFGFAILTTTHGGSVVDFPVLHISVEDLAAHDDLPPEEGVFVASLVLTLYSTGAPGCSRPRVMDDHLEAIECAMYGVSDAQSFLNRPASGVDSRPVDSFHLYDIAPTGLDLSTEDSNWIESRTYDLTVVGVDLVTPTVVVATTANYLTLGGNYITLGGNRITLAS